MNMTGDHKRTADRTFERAVSPVIGVILMVAITVILAAVIGAFVLEIGDQQETAPSTSFDSEQEEVHYKDRNYASSCSDTDTAGEACANVTEVVINHAGGDVIDVSNAEVVVEGNASVWGTESPASSPAGGGGFDQPGQEHTVSPTPNFLPALGTNQRVEFTSGQSWRVSFRGGAIPNKQSWHYNVWNDDYVKAGEYWVDFNADDERTDLWTVRYKGDMSPHEGKVTGVLIEQGNQVNVVWSAESGGKTQTLFKYTVQ